MSGGSFNYASLATDLEELLTKRYDLNSLADRLYEWPDADDAAADLEALLAQVDKANQRVTARLKRLQPVLRAIEWHDSCDWGPDRVAEALATYRGEAT